MRTAESFVSWLYDQIKTDYEKVLKQRVQDRAFIDERVKVISQFNQQLGLTPDHPDYMRVIGQTDSEGRIVFGPRNNHFDRGYGDPVKNIPEFIQGPHVTLFGPPGDAKLCINAMNSYHRKLPQEPEILAEILAKSDLIPFWGADDEDSKTPLMQDLLIAQKNLNKCFNKTLNVVSDSQQYRLQATHLAKPIKRIPGLALQGNFLHLQAPLHLWDFANHLFENQNFPEALCFYIPKIENEEEASYVKLLIHRAEEKIQSINPNYKMGTVKLMIVLENPRAILRANEIITALDPYFAGASLGWHDFLASMARLSRFDSQYRIPVKADPEIVIKHIAASHRLLSQVVGDRGGIKIGGMYGVLPLGKDLFSDSYQLTLKGFFKDVIIQLSRGLDGFWVAHPDFVRLGLALVWSYKNNSADLKSLVKAFLKAKHQTEILGLIKNLSDQKKKLPAKKAVGAKKSPSKLNSDIEINKLIVCDIKKSDFIANNHPDEIRYNVFQSLQYLADWLCGNGCVALPANIGGTAVRVMDDLATCERSRWEVWHEIYHSRFKKTELIKIIHQELLFIRKDFSNKQKIVAVKWNQETAKWYPTAKLIFMKLVFDSNPCEFVSELLMPFTDEGARNSIDPLKKIQSDRPELLKLPKEIRDWDYFYELCSCQWFADKMSETDFYDQADISDCIMQFSKKQVIEAAHFHGDIGESAKTLDAQATSEQARAQQDMDDRSRSELKKLGQDYLKKFGFKFLISAKGKSSAEMLKALKQRIKGSAAKELMNAKKALAEITVKRMQQQSSLDLKTEISEILKKHGVESAQVSVNGSQFGVGPQSKKLFQIASLSKTVASIFCQQYFLKKGIDLDDMVNDWLGKAGSKLQLSKKVPIRSLLNHTALNLHYVSGFKNQLPSVTKILLNPDQFGYQAIDCHPDPGTQFNYSGGGFLILEHLLETLEKKSIQKILSPFLKQHGFYFNQNSNHAIGKKAGNSVLLKFPAFAAGFSASAMAVCQFNAKLARAFVNPRDPWHDFVVQMVWGCDFGSKDFMQALSGLGTFLIEAGSNRFMLHQGANDGFRAIYLSCYQGPDFGKTITVLVNADQEGVYAIAEIVQLLLKSMEFSGIDFDQFQKSFDDENIPTEQKVNQGYKNLLFKAFLPDLPESIVRDNGVLMDLNQFNVLQKAKLIKVSNQKFARAENLISPCKPTFDPRLFGNQGKIMDSWESARHNQSPCDSAEFELIKKSQVNFIFLSTEFHLGNQAPMVSVEGFADSWQTILPQFKMEGHSTTKIKLNPRGESYTKIRVNIYPDGGLSRIQLFEKLPDEIAAQFQPPERAVCEKIQALIPKTKKPMTLALDPKYLKYKSQDLACSLNGGKIIAASNEHYAPASQVISPFEPLNMFDGLENSRSRQMGNSEFVIIELCKKTVIQEIVLDFSYFVNNNPRFVSIEAGNAPQGIDASKVKDGDFEALSFDQLVPKTFVKPFAGNKKIFKIKNQKKFRYLKVLIFPDGGINRIRVF